LPLNRSLLTRMEGEASMLLLLEPDHNAAVVAEVALVVVAVGKTVAEAGQHKIKLSRPDGNVFGQGDIEPTTNDEIPGIVTGVVGKVASARVHTKVVEQAIVGIGVRAAKERFDEGFPMLGAIFENWAHVVGEHVPARLDGATCRAGASRTRRKNEGSGEALIATKFTSDPQPVVDVNVDPTSPTVQGKTANDAAVLRIEPHVGVVHGDFNLSVILCKRSTSQQQNNSENN